MHHLNRTIFQIFPVAMLQYTVDIRPKCNGGKNMIFTLNRMGVESTPTVAFTQNREKYHISQMSVLVVLTTLLINDQQTKKKYFFEKFANQLIQLKNNLFAFNINTKYIWPLGGTHPRPYKQGLRGTQEAAMDRCFIGSLVK